MRGLRPSRFVLSRSTHARATARRRRRLFDRRRPVDHPGTVDADGRLRADARFPAHPLSGALALPP